MTQASKNLWPKAALHLIRTLLFMGLTSVSSGSGLYTQIVLPFDKPRTYTHHYVASEHSLVLEFKNTTPDELSPLERYDERLIKRVLMKHIQGVGTEVKLVLRDRKVRAVVADFKEPFRIIVDLFDARYQEMRDPKTGMPLVYTPGAAQPGPPTHDRFRLLQPPEDDRSYEAANSDPQDIYANHSGSDRNSSESATPPKGRRLLQPTPELFADPQELAGIMQSTATGIGKAWYDFPPYVYRLQTSVYEKVDPRDQRPQAAQALSTAQAMADYAGRLYNFGHESRALVAYQQVLHKEPDIFAKDALHLWKFAEIHLGQGNLTLARGYYESIIEKHPESRLSDFSRLRILDIIAVRLLKQNRSKDLPSLLPRLNEIKTRHIGELQAQIAIRKAYWSQENAVTEVDPTRIPTIDQEIRKDLTASYPNAESSKTALFAATLLLSDMLRDERVWQKATGVFAADYFKRFTGKTTQIFRHQLQPRLFKKLNNHLQHLVTDGRYLQAIDNYEALPRSLLKVESNPRTAWALAEAYRNIGQPEKAIDFYETAANGIPVGPGRFKAQFWLAVTAGDMAQRLRLERAGTDRINRLEQKARAADGKMDATWHALKDDERNKILTAYKDPLEATVSASFKLKTPPLLVLERYSSELSTAQATTSGVSALANATSPAASTAILLSKLARRFSELGMPEKRRETLRLLGLMKPSDFKDNRDAKSLWAKELISLAEDYRKANEYLESGRLYNLIGTEAEDWEGRAEALYKAGLLLYRAGRRTEAIESLRKSANDGNNLFYANLAKERLSQLE